MFFHCFFLSGVVKGFNSHKHWNSSFHEYLLGTWKPRNIRGGTVRPDCHPIQWWAGFSQRVFDPDRGGQRLHSIFRIPPVLPHHMLHRLVAVCFRLGVLSKGDLGWAELMSPFTLDEERPWHGRMVTEGVDGRQSFF